MSTPITPDTQTTPDPNFNSDSPPPPDFPTTTDFQTTPDFPTTTEFPTTPDSEITPDPLGNLYFKIPLYAKIAQTIENEIAASQLPHGHPLFPIRTLASIKHVNPKTIARAYTLLERKGIIITPSTGGSIVNRPGTPEEQSLRREQDLRQLDELTKGLAQFQDKIFAFARQSSL